MKTYIVNGKEIQYDPYNPVNIELFHSEVKRIADYARKAQENPENISVMDFLHSQSNEMMEFFDTVVGEGTTSAIFGADTSLQDIADAYKGFAEEVTKDLTKLAAVLNSRVSNPNLLHYSPEAGAANREQRRREARERASKKAPSLIHADELNHNELMRRYTTEPKQPTYIEDET